MRGSSELSSTGSPGWVPSVPESGALLPADRAQPDQAGQVAVLGVHGGAGATTVAELLSDAIDLSPVDLTRYQLSPDENERVFRKRIVPQLFAGRTPRERPTALPWRMNDPESTSVRRALRAGPRTR
jgi:hypothetical protein